VLLRNLVLEFLANVEVVDGVNEALFAAEAAGEAVQGMVLEVIVLNGPLAVVAFHH